MKRERFAHRGTFLLALLALLPLATACDDATDAGDRARVQVQITDAIADYVETAEVWVSRVYLQGGPGHAADTTDASSGGRVYLFDDRAHPFHVDLLALRDGIVANLTDSVSVDAGTYKQLRIVVDSAKVTLKQGFKFEDGSSTKAIKIPSGSSSGVKVQLSGPVEAAEGEVTVLLADFDVDESLKVQSSPNAPNTLKSITLSPVIKERNRSRS